MTKRVKQQNRKTRAKTGTLAATKKRAAKKKVLVPALRRRETKALGDANAAESKRKSDEDQANATAQQAEVEANQSSAEKYIKELKAAEPPKKHWYQRFFP